MLLDATKAFDKVNYSKFFRKRLLKTLVLRLLIFITPFNHHRSIMLVLSLRLRMEFNQVELYLLFYSLWGLSTYVLQIIDTFHLIWIVHCSANTVEWCRFTVLHCTFYLVISLIKFVVHGRMFSEQCWDFL